MIRKWHFSLFVLAVYVAVFQSWIRADVAWIHASGLAAAAGLSLVFAMAARHGYFVNRWDQGFHAAVILDLLVEALWIKDHNHPGFYLCALGFVVVVGGYRLFKLRSVPDEGLPQGW